MSMPGMTELLIILAVVLLFFGGSKLPKLGGAIGESIKNFKKGVRDDSDRKAISGDDSQNKTAGANTEKKEEDISRA